MNTTLPIVFCHGLLGWGDNELPDHPYFVWAHELKKTDCGTLPEFIFPSTGPVSSLHDQACELFFELKGGLTDYGADHSARFGHKRYTRFYGDKADFDPSASTGYGGPALCPGWDAQHPLDFVGHSMGASVIRMLQYLLAEDFFCTCCGFPEHTDASWVHSATSVAGALNGSSLTWILGADPETGILEKTAYTVRFLCTLLQIAGGWQNRHTDKDFIFDLRLDQWNFSSSTKQSDLFTLLADTNGAFDDGEDWAMYDLTPNAMEQNNTFLTEYQNTWYFSYRTDATFSLFGLVELFIPFVCHVVLWLNALLIGNYRTHSAKWKSVVKTWRRNDGMIPTEAQRYPYVGRSGKIDRKKHCTEIQGTWIEKKYPLCMDHAEPAMLPHWYRKKEGVKFYRQLVERILQTR